MMTRREVLAMAAAGTMAVNGAGAANDPLRPGFHFMPPANWMNDPNGLIQHKGIYHLFYQYNPNGAYWGDMHWGHATSADMVHWKHLPVALAPVKGGPDKDGVFSGCCRMNGKTPTIFYTGVSPETQNIIEANDDLTEFKRIAANPVIAHPPEGLEVTAFRDPNVWREGDEWMMAIGSGRKGGNGMVLLYASSDLKTWRYLHPLAESQSEHDGVIWECPNFFPLGDKWVLMVSADHPIRKPFYWTGRYEGRKFIAEKMGSMDDGGYYYAPQVFVDGKGRTVMFGWVPEGRTVEAQKASGWAGAQGVPRVLGMGKDGVVEMRPIPEMEALRGKRVEKAAALKGAQLEIKAEFDGGTGEACGLAVRVSADGKTRTVVRWEDGVLIVDRSRSSEGAENEREEKSAELKLERGERLRLHVFVDRSIVEVFANGRVCMTSRIYPEGRDCVGVEAIGAERLKAFEGWEMKKA